MRKLSDIQCKDVQAALEKTGGNQVKAAKLLGLNRESFRSRLRAAEVRGFIRPQANFHQSIFPDFLPLDVENGTVLIGSDAHYWPDEPSTAHRAFVHFCKTLNPKVVVLNGDVLDGSTISCHQSIGWENKPSLIEEIEVCKERMDEIYKAAKNATRIWTLGNHDARFETRLANIAPEYAKVHGVHIKDHFPEWEPCWGALVNDDVVVKHRYKGGIHATHNNALWAGKSVVTGHLHSLKVTPFSDYNGTRFGVDCGTLAEPYGEQFRDYTEVNPLNWRSGFAVLTFRDGQLMWPELVPVYGGGRVCFRGELVEV